MNIEQLTKAEMLSHLAERDSDQANKIDTLQTQVRALQITAFVLLSLLVL